MEIKTIGSKSLFLTLATTLALVIFTGCNKESDGDSGSGVDPVLQEKTVITEEAAPEVVASALANGMDSYASDVSGNYSVIGSAAGESVKTLTTPKKIADTVLRLKKQSTSEGVVESRTTQATVTYYCYDGGTYVVNSGTTSGSLTYNSCVDYYGNTYNGTISVSELTWSGYDEAYTFSSNFTIVDSYGDSLVMNGSFSLGAAYEYSYVYYDYVTTKEKIADMSMSVSLTDGADSSYMAVSDYLAAYDYSTPDSFIQSGTYGYKDTISGVTDQAAFTIDMSVTNTDYSYGFPQNGTMTIVGAESSTVVVTFDGGNTVTVTLNGTTIFSGSYYEFDTWLNA